MIQEFAIARIRAHKAAEAARIAGYKTVTDDAIRAMRGEALRHVAPTLNSPRFEWIRKHCNTVRELMGTFAVPHAVATDLQDCIGRGCSEQDANRIAAASLSLRTQVGA